MVRLRHVLSISALLLGAHGLLGAHAFAKDVNWKPFEKGIKEAAAAKKYSFVNVYTDWCGYCKKLEATTLKAKPVVAELDKRFISIRFNAESDETVTWKDKKMTMRELSASWGVEGFPTMLFLNSKGEIIGSFASFAEADLMIKLLTYISSGARERKVSFEDFLKEAS
ncbi:MAG: thioredoxin fold domain-containing protein [Fibrobacterota bacterium]|nr:thioredoxin fold domain-containing protein [Fibrobacterota bacterium]